MLEHKSRWGFEENTYPARQQRVEQPQNVAPVVDTVKVISVQNKSIDSLSNTIQSLTTDKEKLQRQLYLKDTQIDTLTSNFNAASDKIVKLEQELATRNTIPSGSQGRSYYNAGGYVDMGQSNVCKEIVMPTPAMNKSSNTFANPYGNAVETPANLNELLKATTNPYSFEKATNTLATAYKQPVNPMTTFVEFLEELNILEDYMAILLKDGNSIETLCGQYDPSDYIDTICTDDDGDMLDGWDEADALWQEICEADDLDQHEAYVE